MGKSYFVAVDEGDGHIYVWGKYRMEEYALLVSETVRKSYSFNSFVLEVDEPSPYTFCTAEVENDNYMHMLDVAEEGER